MANIDLLVKEVAADLALLEDKHINALASYAKEAAVDILSQRDGRFIELKRTMSIVGDGTTKAFELPQDFNSPYFLALLNDDGLMADFYRIVSLQTIVERRRLNRNIERMAYIDTAVGNSDRFDLVFPVAPSSSVSFRFDYFRIPLGSDVALIKNEELPKKYMRGQFPLTVNPNARADLSVYLKMRKTYSNRALSFVKQRRVQPAWRTQDHNETMGRIGLER